MYVGGYFVWEYAVTQRRPLKARNLPGNVHGGGYCVFDSRCKGHHNLNWTLVNVYTASRGNHWPGSYGIARDTVYAFLAVEALTL